MSGQGDDALPEGRRGQALAVALVLILAAFLWLGVVTPLVGWYQTRSEELASQRALGIAPRPGLFGRPGGAVLP